MNIEFKDTKDFTEKEVEELFLSVGWLSGQYPSRLIKALKSSSLVVTAWDGNKLVGLIRALDDGEMVVFFIIYWCSLIIKAMVLQPICWT